MKATMTEDGCVLLIAQNSLEHFALKSHSVVMADSKADHSKIVMYDFKIYLAIEEDLEIDPKTLLPYDKDE